MTKYGKMLEQKLINMTNGNIPQSVRTIVPVAIIVAAAFGAVLLFQFMFPAPFAIAPGETVTVNDPVPDNLPVIENQTSNPIATPAPQPVSTPIESASILLNVPFTSQAPTGNWNDDRYQNACEEASILMAWHWITGDPLTTQVALDEIADMVAYEQLTFGFYVDTSAVDSAKLMRDYFNYSAVAVKTNITIGDIKQELAAGHVVLVPADGQKLGNPNFTDPGPPRHMLLIKGYDEAKGIFITNDPGTRNGKSYVYTFDTLHNAIRDYVSGEHLPIIGANKVMIVVSKSTL